MTLITRLAGIAASATLTLGTFAVAAQADEVPSDPCATQQAQVDRATTALERVTAVFARQQERVATAKDDVAEAAPGQEKAAAQRVLAAARSAKADTTVTKRAQQMRLAKATERLATCQTENPPATEAPTAS